MAKFQFRLERVRDYRAILEEQAKDAYLDAKVARLEAEAFIHSINDQRNRLLSTEMSTVHERVALQEMVQALDDQERQQKIIVEMLAHDEENRRLEWIDKKMELETLEKLRQKEYEAWMLDESKKEQAALDEWATTRKAA
ncbi:MAG: flagellar FliJ family protein [Fimbriimonadaceae bacterium]|nr:flagellar FliJ family protein [Fimbriimonadaceae bacterium]